MKKFIVAAAALACVPGVAFAQDEGVKSDFSGARIEARIGYETPTVSGDGEVYKIGSAASFGGEIGYDLKAGSKVTVGPYANYEFSSVKLCDGGDCLKEQGNWSVGGRIGFVLGNSGALYAKLGYASMEFKATSGNQSGSVSENGVYGAIGGEFALSKHVYANLEIAYADYGKFVDTDINLQRRQVAAGVGYRF